MALKFRYTKKEEIPTEHAGLYAEREGAWVLEVEGAVDKSRLDEFRQTNIALLKERDELKHRFAGIDPEQVKALEAEKQKLELQAHGHKPEEVERLIGERVKSARAEAEKQLAAIAAERDGLNARLINIQIDQGIMSAATRRGLRATALPDITARARQVFRLVDGLPRVLEADGKTVRTGKDGVSPMDLEEWIETQVTEAPHLFESQAGSGGTTGSAGSSGAAPLGDNPWKKETLNLTKQGELVKKDPTRARQLMAAAGAK
ncbi:MAG TPA: hypothetical protein VNZ22_11605 [Bacillota bacterium]|nr:hypothetical protein [Bacillota bacterium]